MIVLLDKEKICYVCMMMMMILYLIKKNNEVVQNRNIFTILKIVNYLFMFFFFKVIIKILFSRYHVSCKNAVYVY